MGPLNILTLNVQGLNSLHKWTKALKTFTTTKAHVVCLEETNCTPQSTPKFINWAYPQVYTALANSKSRGVPIAFHRSTPFTPLAEIKDLEGRYPIVSGMLLDSEVTVVSYYAPNSKPLPFLSYLLGVVDSHKRAHSSSAETLTNPYTPF